MNLSEYVLSQADRDDPVGDLARDAAADESWPERADYGSLWSYLNDRYASAAVFQALRSAERERRSRQSRE